MGGGQPFLYDAVPKDSTHPYNSFDPKAVSRASLTPKPPKPKQDGPLLNFNKHPDSYLVLPYGNTNAKPMNPSVKARVKWTRIVQLVLRCIELLGAIGLLVTMILITGIETVTAWLMRIPPGVAILHTMYAIYHLGRKPSGRTPASSASYMLFAAGFDVSLIPFYAFGALIASSQYKLSLNGRGMDGEWNTLLPAGQNLVPTLSGTAFLCSVVSGGLHLISLGLSLWLAVTFRKIAKLPPDMNPLEDNLTSRHKRNKSSISTTTTDEKRLSEPLESKRNSGAPYETLSRPPTIPFLQTRQGSTESFSTYRTTPPGSRDSRLDLPSRQYQVQSNSSSPRSSVVDLKRSSVVDSKRSSVAYTNPTSPAKRASYTSLPLSEQPSTSSLSQRSSRPFSTNMSDAWHTAESLPISHNTRSRSSSPMKGGTRYRPLYQNVGREEEDLDITIVSPAQTKRSTNALRDNFIHPNPLEANPPTPRLPPNSNRARGSALSEISSNQRSVSDNGTGTGDLADIDLERISNSSSVYSHEPEPQKSTDSRRQQRHSQQQGQGPGQARQENPISGPLPGRNPTPANFKARFYGDLKPATPPILVGTNTLTASGIITSSNGNEKGDRHGERQVSSGNDYGSKRGFGIGIGRRDVSGKIAEEGRSITANGGSGHGTWGTRFRKISGLGSGSGS